MSLRSVLARTMLGASAIWMVGSAQADVFVNELHYDDSTAAGDINEGIEVVATGGEDLTTYSLVLYNGPATYDTDAVPAGAVVSCTAGGSAKIANLAYPTNGVQNGPADGIALVQSATVIQFLSYEGPITATNGPAVGMTSTDIGVGETNTTVPGTSLQLSGSGSTYASFTWQASAAHTRGACNNGQSFAPPVDNLPTVTTTAPDNLATGVPVATNITVTFSEPVNTDAGAFTLSCPSNTNVPLTITGTGNARTLDPNVDLPFGETCTATVVAANVNDLDGTLDDMAANYVWTFTTVADTVPTIASTVPASGATGIAVNAVVVINFSEPVNPTIPWITLTCNATGYNGTLVGSNGNATWTLDPFTNYNNGDVCTVQITGANVVDIDGTPNPLAGNPSLSFTIAPDLVPTVVSTYPVDLDVNVPAASNLTVVFSEPVTVQSGAFSISCDVSGAHPFAQTDTAQTQYTLNPNADFNVGEECTFDITASLITDIDGVANALNADKRVTFTVGEGIESYYERVDTSSCRALRATLHGVIDDHSAVAYSDSGNTWTPGIPSTYDVWEVLNIADEDPLDTGKILDIYRNESYTKIDGGTGIYNREHVWPNSQGFADTPTLLGLPNSPYTDTHMLMASNTDYNARRGSRLFGTCNPAVTPSCTVDATISNPSDSAGGGPTAYVTPTGHNWYTSGVDGPNGTYEVWGYRRGDLARAMLYMDVRYEGGSNSRTFLPEPQLILTDNRSLVINTSSYDAPAYSGLLTPIVAWHNADPPTPREGIRNNVVQSVQGNRNPFIDHPEWVATLFGASCTGPAIVAVDDDFIGTEDLTLNRNGSNDIGVLNDDRAFDGSTLTVSTAPTVQPLHGSVVLSANGQFVYTPAADFCGKDTFTYSMGNGTLTDTAIAHIDLVCVNDAPVTVGTLPNVTINAGTPASIATAGGFSDADGDDLVYTSTGLVPLPATLSVNPATGVISGTPVAGNAGTYAVTIRASEPAPLTGFVSQSFTLTITADNSAIFGNGFE